LHYYQRKNELRTVNTYREFRVAWTCGFGLGSPGCKAGVDILAQRRPQTSPNVAQLIVSSEFTVNRTCRLYQHLLSCCRDMLYDTILFSKFNCYSAAKECNCCYRPLKRLPILVTKHWAGADSGVQAISPELIINHPSVGKLSLLSARPAVNFPAAQHHRPLAGTKSYCLVTEAHRCERTTCLWMLCSFCPE